MGIKTLDPKDK